MFNMLFQKQMKNIIKKWLNIKTEDIKATISKRSMFDTDDAHSQFTINLDTKNKLNQLRDSLRNHKETIDLILKHLKLERQLKPGTRTEDEVILMPTDLDLTAPLKKSKKTKK